MICVGDRVRVRADGDASELYAAGDLGEVLRVESWASKLSGGRLVRIKLTKSARGHRGARIDIFDYSLEGLED